MKFFSLLIFTICSFTAQAQVDFCSKDSLAAAKRLLEQTRERADSGLIDFASLQIAKEYYVDERYCMGEIDKATYCSSGISYKQMTLDAVTYSYEVGTRKIEDVIQALNNLHKARADCKN